MEQLNTRGSQVRIEQTRFTEKISVPPEHQSFRSEVSSAFAVA